MLTRKQSHAFVKMHWVYKGKKSSEVAGAGKKNTSLVPPIFLSSLCKPTCEMWMWRLSLNLQKVSKITQKGYHARTRMACAEAGPQHLGTSEVIFVSWWGGCWGVAGPSPAAGPTVISWWMSVQLFYYEREWIFPYVCSKICYYKFYVLYKYWFVCSF